MSSNLRRIIKLGRYFDGHNLESSAQLPSIWSSQNYDRITKNTINLPILLSVIVYGFTCLSPSAVSKTL